MKLLITGTNGFIGSNLVRYLHEYTPDQYDISMGYTRPRDLNIHKYDWVLHIGACSSTVETDVQKVMDLNVSWPIELFEECIKHNTNFQWSSSASVYGKSIIFKESEAPEPLNLYARSKALLENYITTRQADIIWQGFRYFNVYGPGEEHKGNQASPHQQFTDQAIKTGKIKLFEESENFRRDFVPIETVCYYHKKLLSRDVSGIFNIGTGRAKSFFEVAEEIASKHNAEIEYIPFPDNLKSHYQTYTCADISLINSII
jgi:ADP-L-glycero-D-manno-heptose 6-epimerase